MTRFRTSLFSYFRKSVQPFNVGGLKPDRSIPLSAFSFGFLSRMSIHRFDHIDPRLNCLIA